MRPVVVLGDLMVDVVARVDGPLAHGSDTPARVRTRPGGSGATVAAWLAVAGAPVTLIARAGADDAGRRAADLLRGHGVTTAVAFDEDRHTGTCVVLVHPGGERTMLPDAGANAALNRDDLPAEAFADGAHLHLTGYTLLRGGPAADAAGTALRTARSHGMTISVDPSSAAPLGRFGASRFLEAVGHTDLLLPNRDEAAALTGAGDPRRAARALAAHAREVVVTLGADGALWSDGTQTSAAPATYRGDVTDTTGAGDAFAAGWLAARLNGAEPGRALRAADALAARALAVASGA